MSMTRGEFLTAYLQEKSGSSYYSVESLHRYGREVRPCDCDYAGCQGWQMAHVGEELKFARAMGFQELTADEVWPVDSPRPRDFSQRRTS